MAASESSVVRVAPPSRLRFPELSEFVSRRELLFFLVQTSIVRRYTSTAVGLLWVILQPLAMMLVFVMFFDRVLALDSEGIPFPLFVYSALIGWQYFSNSVTDAMTSVSRERELIRRVYLPRVFLPVVAALSHLVDLGASLLLLAALMLVYDTAPDEALLLLPAFLVLVVCLSVGVGVWLSALSVLFRDVPYAVPFVLQLLFFSSPIFYTVTVLEDRWRFFYQLNPLASIIQGLRWTTVGGDAPSAALAGSVAIAVAILTSGLLFFGSREADMINHL